MVGVWIIEQKVPYLVVLKKLVLLEISLVIPGNAAATALGAVMGVILAQSLSEDNTKK